MVLRTLGILLGVVMLVGGGGCFVVDAFLTLGTIAEPHANGDMPVGPWALATVTAIAFTIAVAGLALLRRCTRAAD